MPEFGAVQESETGTPFQFAALPRLRLVYSQASWMHARDPVLPSPAAPIAVQQLRVRATRNHLIF